MENPDQKLSLQKRDWVILIVFAAIKLLIHFLANGSGGYGIFRDEYYYLACANRLDFRYVDQPPFSIYVLNLSRLLFGDSMFGLRVVPALAGAAAVWIIGLMAKRMGGQTFALILACVSVIFAPVILAFNNFSLTSSCTKNRAKVDKARR